MTRRPSIALPALIVITALLAIGIIAAAVDSTKTEQVQK